MSPPISSEALAVLTLEEELLRAREFEAAGKEHLEAQEKRVARLGLKTCATIRRSSYSGSCARRMDFKPVM